MTLTNEQLAAAQCPSESVLCVAGAGSGKTRVLVARIQWLLEQRGVSASDLMVLTFTRKAAGEMIGRLEAALGDKAMRGAMIGTFHSVALSILLAEGDKLGYDTKTLTIVEPYDSELLLEEAASELGYLKDGNWKNGLSTKRCHKYLEESYTGQTLTSYGVADSATRASIFHCYRRKLRELNALDFGSILMECNRLLTEDPEVLARYRARIKHVLVDELQDADAVQYRLHKFFSPPANFFGVGDPRQTIYGFRGARPDLMLDPETHICGLTECFRCGSAIVAAANRLIAHNHERECEPMLPSESCGPGFLAVRNGRSADVLKFAQACGELGYGPGDIAILARNHRALRRLATVAQELGVPVHRVGGGFEVCDTESFRTLHALLRLACNPRDRIAEWRLRRVPANHAGVDLLTNGADHGDVGPDMNIMDFLALTKPDTSHPNYLFWQSRCATMTLGAALRWFALRDSQDDADPGDKITLSTVHAAKGLEWPVVIVAECMEGTFPSHLSIRENPDATDERRLMYVAMTRAKERLLLHYRAASDQSEDAKFAAPSRFLKEI